MGRGYSLFCEHWWISDSPLKEVFPRLYNTSNQKEWLIINMGHWDGQRWNWLFSWRRDFLVWENELYDQLVHTLNQRVLNQDDDDSLNYEEVWFHRYLFGEIFHHACWQAKCEKLIWKATYGNISTGKLPSLYGRQHISVNTKGKVIASWLTCSIGLLIKLCCDVGLISLHLNFC